jgi:Asp-tRNA(Asn)/Glu-tRNA(Gln) amidotransferase A subunit family amidase
LKRIETLTALEAVRAIEAHELTCEALVRACLDRIFSQAAGDTRRAPRP